MTPTRLREIASQLEKACSSYQEKIMQGGYLPCRCCAEMAKELRQFALKLGPHAIDQQATPIPALENAATHETNL